MKTFTNPHTAEIIEFINADGNYEHKLYIDKKALNASQTGINDIYGLYKTCSWNKVKIWNEWNKVIKSLNGYDVNLQGNSNTFSIAFKFVKDSVLYQAYITKSYNRIYPINL